MDENAEKSVRIADQHARLLGNVSALFSSCIRTIREAERSKDANPNLDISGLTQGAALTLVNMSPTLKALFYFAATHFYPEAVQKLLKPSIRDILKLFDSAEIAGILGVSYLFRRLEKLCDEDELERLMPNLLTHMEIGGIVGETLNYVGSGYGMLGGAVRYIALGTFIIGHVEEFKKYRRKVSANDQLFDVHEEERLWGCNHLQVASLLVQSLGYGVPAGFGLVLAEAEGSPLDLVEDRASNDEVRCWRAAMVWTEALHRSGEPPPGFDDQKSEMYLESDSVRVLTETVAPIRKHGSNFQWLLRRRSDVPEELRASLGVREPKPKASPKEKEQEDDGILASGTPAEE